jgi:hypothetical protein
MYQNCNISTMSFVLLLTQSTCLGVLVTSHAVAPQRGWTALHFAASKWKNRDAVATLLNYDADVRALTKVSELNACWWSTLISDSFAEPRDVVLAREQAAELMYHHDTPS